jgi:hypothetical protein
MASGRKLTPEQLRLAVLLAILVIVGGIAVSRMIRQGGLSDAAGREAAADYEPRDLPQLAEVSSWDPGQAVGESPRNPFTFGAPPTPTRNLTPPPTRVPLPTRVPRPTPTPRLYHDPNGNVLGPPPPFEREYLGSFGPNDRRVAAFRRPGVVPETIEIDVGVEGEILDDVFIIREIGLESVLIGFVGYDSSEDTRVPLADD